MKKNDADDPDVCATLGCDQPAALTYLGRARCQACYEDDVADGDETSNATPNHEETEMAKAKKKTTRKSAKTTKAKKAGKGAKQQAKAATPEAARKPAATAKPKRVSAIDAAAEVLRKRGEPMKARDLIAAMSDQGLWQSPNGKTPHATLYAAMLREISAKGAKARFKKVDRGLFAYAGSK